MEIVTTNTEVRLLERTRELKGDPAENYALHFHLSGLSDEYRSDFQLKIAINVLNDLFRELEGDIFLCRDGDLFLVYHGNDRGLLEKAIFQLRYLFVDDPLANHPDGQENEDFCTLYDLGFQWRAFHRHCNDRVEGQTRGEIEHIEVAREREMRAQRLNPKRLAHATEDLAQLDLSMAIRRQPICAITRGKAPRILFNEMYINIGHLGVLLGGQYDLLSERGLFKYITRILDRYVLETLAERPQMYFNAPISLNLNMETILSNRFKEFTDRIKSNRNSSLVLEIHVADVFADMAAFMTAREVLHDMGYRICLDGLTNLSFIQVDRESLGFDLAKLQWNADMVGDLDTEENRRLAAAIKKCGSNRMILCRCDSHHAIEYGHALGISLFQGRYPDRLIDPDATVIN